MPESFKAALYGLLVLDRGTEMKKVYSVGALASAVGFALAVSATPSVASVLVNFPDFTGACSSASLTCVGDTATSGSVLRLTPATIGQHGAAYSTTAVTLGSGNVFSTQFQFRISNTGGIAPADGFTFVLAANTTGLGGTGGGIGYFGVPNSVAVEFDTYDNGETGTSNHVAVDVNGVLNNSAAANPYGVSNCTSTISHPFGCLSNGDIWNVSIGYDGSLLNVTVQDGAGTVQNIISNYAINIGAQLGTSNAFVGFTSGTGSGFANHDILNWQFANTTELAQTPEPATLALLGLGFAGLGFGRRKKA